MSTIPPSSSGASDFSSHIGPQPPDALPPGAKPFSASSFPGGLAPPALTQQSAGGTGNDAADGAQREADPDAQLVQETRNQIRAIVQEITRLAQSDVDEDEFYAEFLKRVVAALASVGAAIWTITEDGIRLRYQINLPREPLLEDSVSAERHYLLLKQMAADGQAGFAPPYSGSDEEGEPANPTEHLLIFGFVQFQGEPLEIVEVFQRPTGGPTTQRGYLRFLAQMCELAQSYVTRRRIQDYNAREALWESLERFIHRVHDGLDAEATCYALVNEARLLVGCDRVSVAVRHGGKYRVMAVSGLDSLDRRAIEVSRLGELAATVSASGQSLWRRDTDEEPLAPQVERALDAYLDAAHSKLVVVRPLFAAERCDEEEPQAHRREPIGALIIEQLRDSRTEAGAEERVAMIARHGGSALGNALEHERLFLMPLWRALGRSRWVIQSRQLPRTLTVGCVLAAIFAALAFIPAPLKYKCNGQLVPSTRYDRFARVDGVVDELPVRGGQIVEPGDLIVRLRSAPLREKRTRLEGELLEKRQQYKARNALLLQNERLDRIEQQRIEGELRQLEQTTRNLQQRLDLVAIEETGLEVRAERRGQIADWRLQERLAKRPVRRGDRLTTLFDPEGDWELELWMPERRLGRIANARAASGRKPLLVEFILASHPDLRFEGELVELERTADVREGEGNIVRLRVRIDKNALPELRNEARLTAQVYCGRESVGRVWFGDAIETAQKQLLLWF